MTSDTSPVPDYSSLLRLDGQSAVVLGAGFGMGRQSAHALSQAGATVFCVDFDQARAEAVATEVGGVPLSGDVTRREDMERLFEEVRAKSGRVDCVVDIVGMAHLGPLEDLDDAGFDRQFDIILRHAFLATQIGGKAIAETGGGSLIFIGSIAGTLGLPGQTAYGSAKAALHHMVKCMGAEYGPKKVRVNAVAPGFVRTPRLNELLTADQWGALEGAIPIGKAADPSEIASAVLFLASGLSSHVTGHILMTDGGLGARARLPEVW